MKTYILDGAGFLFRAYHAFPYLTDKDGHNINVIYGFFRIIFKIFSENPNYFVVVRDMPEKTVRHKIYEKYKANRPPAPDDFKYQVPLVHNLVKELGIPSIGISGYEADDVIKTLVEGFNLKTGSNCNMTIFSSDKDLKQLLDENIVIKDPMKGIISNIDTFKNEYNFEPKYMLDYLALIGDSADNIKGVQGIGPKKALSLIQKYKTIENIYDNIEKINGDLKKKLLEGKEDAKFSKKLVELLIVEDCDCNLENYKIDIDVDKFKNLLVDKYGFKSLEKIIDDYKKNLYKPKAVSLF